MIAAALQLHLKNSVRPTTSIISSSGPTRPLFQSVPNKLHNILYRLDRHLRQPTNIDLLLIIFKTLNLFLFIKQIKELDSIYLVKRDGQIDLGKVLQRGHDVSGCQQV